MLTEENNLSENLNVCYLEFIVWMFLYEEFKFLEF